MRIVETPEGERIEFLEATDDPIILPPGRINHTAIILECFPGTGSIEVQQVGPDGQWYTPAEPNHTITATGKLEIPAGIRPTYRIRATGDGEFILNGSVFS